MSKELLIHGDCGPSNEENIEMKKNRSAMSIDEPRESEEMLQLKIHPDSKAESIVQDTGILDPSLRDSLPLVFNQLDPISFVKLARTCRMMQGIFFNTERIDFRFGDDYWTDRIPMDDPCVIAQEVYVLGDDSKPEGFRFELLKYNSQADIWHDISEEHVERMRKKPFLFVIDCLCLCDCLPELNTRRLEALGLYLRRFRLIVINSIVLSTEINDWNKVSELVQEFRVRSIKVTNHRKPIPENLLPFFTTQLVQFHYGGYASDDVILAAKTKELHFEGVKISADTFKKLLEKFSAGEMHHWKIGRERQMRRHSDPFLDACADVMKVVIVRDVDSCVKDPGVLYMSFHSLGNFSFLRADGSIGRIHICRNNVVFN